MFNKLKVKFMKYIVIIWMVFWLALTGCATTQGDEFSGFAQSIDISALSGVYRNKAEANSTALPPRYLSAFLWRGDTSVPHAAVHTVLLEVKNDMFVQAQAFGKDGQVMASNRLECGTHFEFKAGLLQLKTSVQAAGFKSGEPMVGVAKESIVFGLDDQGHGKLRQLSSATGMAFLMLPIHVSDEANMRFVRIR